MPEGKHCPDCGAGIGVWTAKFAWFSGGRIRCPHCRRGLFYEMKPADSIIALLAFLAIWIGANVVSSLTKPGRSVRLGIELGFFCLAFLAVSFGAAGLLRAGRALRTTPAPPDRGRSA